MSDPGQALPNVAAALSGCCPGTESRLGPGRADKFLACISIILTACVCSGSLQQLRRKKELKNLEKRVKNECEKLDHGTWCLEMKQDFSGKL